ncbi:MAG: glycosyltransferase family 25 protein [Sphingobacteriaceae bacterium]|nr:glycosyltransferase family 25 protein [Sphingobacteriaceae bacterium]
MALNNRINLSKELAYSMKIFVTNLKTSPDRRTHIIKEFEGKGLDFSFVDCVIGKDLSEKELHEKCDMKKINHFNREVEWFTKGVIGCTLTNQNTYRTIIENNYEMALLLEDDTILPDNLKQILTEIENSAKQGDVILLFYLTYTTLKLKALANQNNERPLFYEPLNPECIHGGSAVVVTRKAAENMLKYNTPIRMSPDSWKDFYEANCIGRLLCVHPMPINTADFGTTMGYVRDSVVRKLMISNPFTRFVLKMKRKFYRISKQKVEIVK